MFPVEWVGVKNLSPLPVSAGAGGRQVILLAGHHLLQKASSPNAKEQDGYACGVVIRWVETGKRG